MAVWCWADNERVENRNAEQFAGALREFSDRLIVAGGHDVAGRVVMPDDDRGCIGEERSLE